MKISAQFRSISGGITAVKGFVAAGLYSGIKKNGKPDLALIFNKNTCTVAGVFTKNRFCAAPLLLCKKHLKKGRGQAIIVNSGNANAFTGKRGLDDAKAMATATAQQLGIDKTSVYVASTGVIGEALPIDPIIAAIPNLVDILSRKGSFSAAEAIKTTDTFAKEIALEGRVGEQKIRVGGIAKGSGMIHPNMATMLGFLATDVNMTQPLLQDALKEAVDGSFHRITVDGDTSTNDMVLLFSNNQKGKTINKKGPPFRDFVALLKAACLSLAKMLVIDGEGATKCIEIRVTGAKDNQSAQSIAFAVAQSNLVKTAFFGEDANWGRIVAAIGNAGVKVSPEEIHLSFGDLPLVHEGKFMGKAAESKVAHYLKNKELQLNIALSSGKGCAEVWTSDLSLDYIKINALYRS